MSEYDDFFSEEFFIIDSNELENTKSKLYGYIINNENVITEKNFNVDCKISPNGAYVYVNKNDKHISIHQDFNGSYGIYIYKNEDYFCLSNSFLKLVDYIKNKYYPITFNKNCADALLLSDYSSFTYRQTLINEIECLPRNHIIHINTINKEIKYEIIDYNEKSVSINSQEGMEILDNWFLRWTSLLRNLKKETNNLSADLTSGFDSRLAFILVMASNIDLNQMYIHSIDDGVHTHDEDFEIATEIANYYDFKLNNMSNFENERYDYLELETPINLSFNTKLGFHNQMYYHLYRNKNPIYKISGYNGENIRDYPDVHTLEDYMNMAYNLSSHVVDSTKKILDFNIEHIKEDFKNIYDDDIEYGIYKETMLRYHFGKHCVEDYLNNEITLTPLSDSELYKLRRNDENCDDKNLLMYIIYLRYFPKLLEFRYGANHPLNYETIDYAQKIVDKYPIKHEGYELISKENPTPNPNYMSETEHMIKREDINDLMTKIFLSTSFRKTFESYYPNEIYEFNKYEVEHKAYFPHQYAFPSFAILRILNDIKISNKSTSKQVTEWLEEFLEIPEYSKKRDSDYSLLKQLSFYYTARIDIITDAGTPKLELIHSSDEKNNVYSPNWLQNGNGIIIESSKKQIDLVLKCIDDCEAVIYLRGRDIRDKNRNRFPVYIDFTKFIVNNKECLNGNKLIWHDNPFEYKIKLKKDQILIIQLAWTPFTEDSEYII